MFESLSWNQIEPVKSIERSSSYTEIFDELHSKFNQNEDSGASDTSQIPYSSSSFSNTPITNHTNRHKTSDSFSSLSSESLQLCTEGLGSESSDDVVEDLKSGMSEHWRIDMEKEGVKKKHLSSYGGECRRSGEYPPPISCLGRTGKPCVVYRSYRSNGRFVLEEIRIPTKEFLHASREDGRLKLHFVQPDDDEFLEEDDGDLESTINDEEESIGKENDICVTHPVNEEKRE